VSAVTGACLAVAREKYDAVGGLDEVAFPISFNDIDLCLKLRERGWTNIQASDAVLFHRESASRGSDVGPKQALADLEAARFKEKWIEVIRDDPFYHPGLSLARFDASLG
jgi:GT2 family glycosyltransferase